MLLFVESYSTDAPCMSHASMTLFIVTVVIYIAVYIQLLKHPISGCMSDSSLLTVSLINLCVHAGETLKQKANIIMRK